MKSWLSLLTRKNVLSLIARETTTCVYSWASGCASAPIEVQAKGDARPQDWSSFIERGPQPTFQKAVLSLHSNSTKDKNSGLSGWESDTFFSPIKLCGPDRVGLGAIRFGNRWFRQYRTGWTKSLIQQKAASYVPGKSRQKGCASEQIGEHEY